MSWVTVNYNSSKTSYTAISNTGIQLDITVSRLDNGRICCMCFKTGMAFTGVREEPGKGCRVINICMDCSYKLEKLAGSFV